MPRARKQKRAGQIARHGGSFGGLEELHSTMTSALAKNLGARRKGWGGLRFNPKARLDPSQVEGLTLETLKRARTRHEFERQLDKFPFLNMTQRMEALAMWAKYRPDVKNPHVTSIPVWFGKTRRGR